MEPLVLILVAAVLWTQGWNMAGFFSDNKMTGIVAATVAIALTALVVFEAVPPLTQAAPDALAVFSMLWVIYSAALAAHGLWNFHPRAFGMYAVSLAVGMLFFVVYFIVGDFADPGVISSAAGAASLVLALQALLVFLYYTPPLNALKVWTGWVLIVGSVLVGLIGLGAMLNIYDITI